MFAPHDAVDPHADVDAANQDDRLDMRLPQARPDEQSAVPGHLQSSLGERPRRARGDAFETLRQLAQPPLSDEVTARLLTEVHAEDSAVARRAEDLLLRHNIPWITHCIAKHPCVTSEMLAPSSALRDDLMSEGCFGFLIAVRRYDPDQARRGIDHGGRQKTLLKYAQLWIDNVIRVYIGPERYRLKARTGHKRHLVLTASETLRRRLGRVPQSTEIADYLEAEAREKQRAAGVLNPTRQQLRNMGALSPTVITTLLSHVAATVSLDEPIEGTGTMAGRSASGVTWASYLPDEASLGQAEAHLIRDDQARGIAGILRVIDPRLPNPVLRRLQVRMLYGLPSERGNPGYPFTAEEISYVLGRSPETVRAYEERLRLSLRGEELVPAAQLIPLQDAATDLRPEISVGDRPTPSSVVVTVVPQRKARLNALR